MKERKYIDRLYQEKFKDFEATPNEAVWRSISAKLQEREQKRVFITPFWSRMAGIAAVLAIIFLIGDWIFPAQTGASIANEDLEEELLNRENNLAGNRLMINPDEMPTNGPVFDEPVKDQPFKRPSENAELIPIKPPKSREAITSEKNNIASSQFTRKRSESKSGIKKRSLFDEINRQEQQVVEESSRSNFEVSTHAAPIYYGNFGKGNFLDPRFKENNSEGEVTFSYGVNIAYNISDRVKIRSGVNKVNMSFNTNGIPNQAVVDPTNISSVAFSDQTEVVSDASGRSSTTKQPVANNNREFLTNFNSGLLNQKMGFIEVPVELEYNLINKRFELNLIGGASTLFLDENRVSMNSGNVSAIGKASNLNEISFSTNIGLGVDYNLSEKFKLNFEPMLKYQFNTFSSNPAGTQPYYLGIYSGFSYKF
ncbi:hypothetical protein SAMN04488034_101387 [Salinimicrobium catena]|uniref:Outer membrane protein beta-barrel domain-containing protein n=1 Tax=Salinimicrobium catena TaxID=390640 RepID=A0A1H5IBY7_9FLAO|nr:hypothetical protein [Salinimicrobium catena]SDK76479.1 hypothetical protein SAMN04488140_101387 [Salinimicrobium catena]SEE37695.1 hypothetical protein SAMN04488034_101387 [Salinimicrobium catena]